MIDALALGLYDTVRKKFELVVYPNKTPELLDEVNSIWAMVQSNEHLPPGDLTPTRAWLISRGISPENIPDDTP